VVRALAGGKIEKLELAKSIWTGKHVEMYVSLVGRESGAWTNSQAGSRLKEQEDGMGWRFNRESGTEDRREIGSFLSTVSEGEAGRGRLSCAGL